MFSDKTPLTWEQLYNKYVDGYFPMADETGRITWHNPRHRAVFDINTYKPKKSLRTVLNSGAYTVKINENFEAVIKACSKPRDAFDGQWLNQSMISAYIGLHQEGFAHSVEIYKENTLVGGLYGVHLGGIFFGESMFSTASNASKIAFHHLMLILRANDFILLDSQYLNDHTAMLGAIEISQDAFLETLNIGIQLTRHFKLS
jgi:leucyl/phenylalanyl-tRNA--protein transferase